MADDRKGGVLTPPFPVRGEKFRLEAHPEIPPGDCVREFLKEELSGLLN
jgi:hypothetical protein